MIKTAYDVGAAVLGGPTSPRALVQHRAILNAYAEDNVGDYSEGYLSHYIFGHEMESHYSGNRNSVAGFAGPHCCHWLTFDIDREIDLPAALADTRRLAQTLGELFPTLADEMPVYFTGKKGFAIMLPLAHCPAPAVGFNRTARTFAERLAALAGVQIDVSIYDVNHIIRLPNTRHPKTKQFKRRLLIDELFRLEIPKIFNLALHPRGESLPWPATPPAGMAEYWAEAEAETRQAAHKRAAIRQERGRADVRAPKYFMDLLRFGVESGERHSTLFRSAAWLAEQGAPATLAAALLTEPGLDVGLTPADVERQIRCGIAHATKQRGNVATPTPPAVVDCIRFEAEAPAGPPTPPGFDHLPEDERETARERWAIQNESEPLAPGATDFPFGALAPEKHTSEGGSR